MALTAFNRKVGELQGRLAVATSQDGTHAFILGSMEPGVVEWLEPGNYVEVATTTDLTNARYVRAHVLFRVPKFVPTGYRWSVSLMIEDFEMARYYGYPNRIRRISDLTGIAEGFIENSKVAIRLTLSAV